MENFQRIKELTKERLRERRRERWKKILWHVVICSSIIVILLSFAVIFLTAKADKESTHKIVIHSECEENVHYAIKAKGEVAELLPVEGNVIVIKYSADAKDGNMSEESYVALVALTAQLIDEYELEIDDIIRHYDTSEKTCPEYFVEYESAWEDFKIDVEEYKK